MPCSETKANETIRTLGYVLMVVGEAQEGKSNCESVVQTLLTSNAYVYIETIIYGLKDPSKRLASRSKYDPPEVSPT